MRNSRGVAAGFALAALGVVGWSASVQVAEGDLATAEPEAVGMSTARLERIGPAMQRYIDADLVAGTVTLVARRGRIVHLEARGHRDVETASVMTTDTMFRLASMTKPIASVALMMLWEEGKVRLQDPVEDYLPEFADARVSTTGDASGQTGTLVRARRPMTVRQLLTHTSGLANRYTGNTAFYEAHMGVNEPVREETLEVFVKRLAELPLNYEPGTDWQYSHATDVVARLVEVISGQSFDVFLSERIFEPLGMRSTSHYVDAASASRLAALYRPSADRTIALADPGSAASPLVSGPRTLFRGATGLVSTATDYARFQQMMLNGGVLGGARLLGPRTVELMLNNHAGDLYRPDGLGFGLGYAVLLDPGAAATPQTTGSAWWAGAYGTSFWIDPAEDLVGVLLMQVRPNNHLDIRTDFRNLVYQAIVE